MKSKSRLKGPLLVVLAGVAWSFSGILGKFTPWSAMSIFGYRAVIATILFGLVRKNYRLVHTQWTWLGSVGVAATSLLFMFANKITTSANAIVLQYAMPAVVIVLQVYILHKLPRREDILAALAVMLGIILCFAQSMGSGKLLGDGLALASAFTWALVFFAGRMPGVDSMDYSYQGNLLSCLAVVMMPGDPGIAAGGLMGWLAATVMGLCLFLGYLFFSLGMREGVPTTTAAVVSNVEPVLNPLWVLLFLGESPGWLSLVGMAIVLITVTVYSLKKKEA